MTQKQMIQKQLMDQQRMIQKHMKKRQTLIKVLQVQQPLILKNQVMLIKKIPKIVQSVIKNQLEL